MAVIRHKSTVEVTAPTHRGCWGMGVDGSGPRSLRGESRIDFNNKYNFKQANLLNLLAGNREPIPPVWLMLQGGSIPSGISQDS